MDIFLQTTSALNDETRVKLLKFINIYGSCCVCDLENSFSMIQSRLSRHLKILKEAGFLKVNREGRWAYYSVRSPLDEFRQACIKEIMYLDITLPTLKKSCIKEKDD
ncbi:transcriptional regulator [Malaciobacter mytili]|uniref:Transcriptional regulator n=1 Tax=Malaciobacter mytili LMG 24559 TaxID=1032238 RepID=A0AAX2AHU6_9BACT|nr:metalloregulator ArsR/SmtB family transcription factor [Malaciobacter mytili]AXH16045.1 transcriptional regulator, ArsR family [Malaciobacter mytili LMG 24559]RXI48852.1 transcriptional regulator [Malaciobacter mytili]RXK15771.1 transcriptional regulator [Malaciobacter mytili LMG 24559]